MQITVECKKRPEGSKPNALRREGFIPAALYGHNGTESVSLVLDKKEAQNLLKVGSVNNTLIDLKVSDLPWSGKALLREVQTHPWKNTLYHLSFFSVAAQGDIEVTVPVNLMGEAPGVKLGGILEQMITELRVQCAPENIPENIEVNMSNFEIGSSLHINELVVPEGITVMDDGERTIFAILAPKMSQEESTETVESEG